VHEAVLASGDSETGATVHLVDEEFDTGPIVGQTRVPVRAGDGVEDIEERVMTVERELVVATLAQAAKGGLLVSPRCQPPVA
jgi:phosphoribosylglycinamide formyltransferase 1